MIVLPKRSLEPLYMQHFFTAAILLMSISFSASEAFSESGCDNQETCKPNAAESEKDYFRLEYVNRACQLEKDGGVLSIAASGDMTYQTSRLGEGAPAAKKFILTRAELQDLASLAVSSGFFELESRYAAPGVLDGSCNSLQISAAGKSHSVALINKSPPAVDRLVAAIERLRCAKGDWEICLALARGERQKGNTEEAKRFYKAACKEKGEACFELGIMEHAAGSAAEANRLFKLSCALDTAICVMIGNLMEGQRWTGVEAFRAAPDNFAAREYFAAACSRGYTAACQSQGRLEQKLGNTTEAERLFKPACDRGRAEGCYSLAEAQEKLGKPLEAEKLYRQACEQGDGYQCVQRAIKSENNKDPAAARQWYKLACNEARTDSLACSGLARIERSEGHVQEAKRLFKITCDGGDVWGCESLGDIEAEQGNLSEARKFYDVAGNGSCCGVQLKLADIDDKMGKPADADRLRAEACSRIPAACCSAGQIRKAQGDNANAHKLFRLACKAGYLEACALLPPGS